MEPTFNLVNEYAEKPHGGGGAAQAGMRGLPSGDLILSLESLSR